MYPPHPTPSHPTPPHPTPPHPTPPHPTPTTPHHPTPPHPTPPLPTPPHPTPPHRHLGLGGWVWVGLGGFTIISDFRGTCGSGGTVKQKQKSDTCAIHCAAHHFEMDAFCFESFAHAVVITSLYLSSLLFSFLLIITTRSCSGWVGGWVVGGWVNSN